MKLLLKKIYQYWMKFVYVLGYINSRIIFTILYVFLVGIYAIISWLINFISKRKKAINNTYWLPKEYEKPTKEILRRQF